MRGSMARTVEPRAIRGAPFDGLQRQLGESAHQIAHAGGILATLLHHGVTNERSSSIDICVGMYDACGAFRSSAGVEAVRFPAGPVGARRAAEGERDRGRDPWISE